MGKNAFMAIYSKCFAPTLINRYMHPSLFRRSVFTNSGFECPDT
ncbi:hypothetical protein KsCSTR_08930 [Candidatus Kuenenia stuttgartiensis]|uniref:Uncharacterized protein n=1 Tax=Kuenenia stuttgartiensis TaxID=174633 RepID=A0A6G7GLN5_KUEST|nr:hypothetical protein KsCSTR_08930 [Candidatus Kuenenia stuttgartiensis]